MPSKTQSFFFEKLRRAAEKDEEFIAMQLENDKQKEYFDQTFELINLSQKILLSKEFENCKFNNCNFSEADFQKCKFCDCTFEDCNLSVIKVKCCRFNNVEFINSKIVGVNWTEIAWPIIKLACPIRFTKCNVSHSIFFGLNLQEISFIECKVNDVDFREADLSKANFSFSDLANSMFVNSNLTTADFSYAYNYSIDIKTNKVSKAKFMLPEATALLQGLDIDLVDSI